jgi:sialic acid synthase SpsE
MSDKLNENLFNLLQADPGHLYFIAEAGLNHGGSKERALAMVRAAKWAGADAVKFQTFKADRLTAKTKSELTHKKGVDLQEMFRQLELSHDEFRVIHKEATRLDIEFLSTPFDEDSADFLDELGVGAFKVASGDITHRPLVKHLGSKGKPILLSTGMSTSEEIEKAIDWIFSEQNTEIILLHCISAYPPKPEELNIKSVEFLRDRFGLPVGFSDHSVDSMGAIVAVSLGAQVVERHFMLDTRGNVPDRDVSFDTKQLRSHIQELRAVGTILGERGKVASESESANLTASRRSLYARRPIESGETISSDMLYALRPAVGISPEFVDDVVGRSARSSIGVDEPVKWDSIG